MKRKTKGSVTASVVLFVASGVFASVLGLRQYDRATTTLGWVSSSALEAGQIVTRQVLTQARVKIEQAGIGNPQHLLGKRLTVDKRPGDTFLPGDVKTPEAPPPRSLAQHVPEGRVLYTLSLTTGSTIPLSQLNNGDRLDVLVSGRRGVRTAATDVRLIGVIRKRAESKPAAGDQKITSLLPQKSKRAVSGSTGDALVLAVSPEHVYPLANIGGTDKVSLVLHSAHDVASGKAVSVTPTNRQRPVEVVVGLSRTTVYVSN